MFLTFTRKKLAKNKQHVNSKDIVHVFIQYRKFNNCMNREFWLGIQLHFCVT